MYLEPLYEYRTLGTQSGFISLMKFSKTLRHRPPLVLSRLFDAPGVSFINRGNTKKSTQDLKIF